MSSHRWYDRYILQAKHKAKIIILGSYDAIKRLSGVKNYLRANDYKNAKLVADVDYRPRYSDESEEEYNFRKSLHAMGYADILLFVFYDNVKNQGVDIEISCAAQQLREKIPYSSVFIEKSYQQKTSTMLRGLIRNYKIDCKFFEDDEELKQLALGACVQHLYKLDYIWSP